MFNRSQTQSAVDGVFRNPHLWFATATVIALQAGALHIAPLRRLLHLVLPTGYDWIVLAGCLTLFLLVVETQKAISRQSGNDPTSRELRHSAPS